MNIDAVQQDLRKQDEEMERVMARQRAVKNASDKIGDMTVDELSALIDWMRVHASEYSHRRTKAQLTLSALDRVMQDASELMVDTGAEVYP